MCDLEGMRSQGPLNAAYGVPAVPAVASGQAKDRIHSQLGGTWTVEGIPKPSEGVVGVSEVSCVLYCTVCTCVCMLGVCILTRINPGLPYPRRALVSSTILL